MLTGRKDYLPKLLEWIPRENLPDFFGGTDTSCDFVTEKGPWAEHWAVRAYAHAPAVPRPLSLVPCPSSLAHRPSPIAHRKPRRFVRFHAARQDGCLFGGSAV